MVGLGTKSVQSVPVGDDLKMDIHALEQLIQSDVENGRRPFMIIGTAGTTGTGTIDDLTELARVSKANDTWFHVDAAYGGAAVFNANLKPTMNGIELSDSITFDAHKWLSMPMGTSILLTSHSDILSSAFSISTAYMPTEAEEMPVVDPYSHSVQWSRRSLGIRLYLTLLMFGWEHYDKVIGHQARIGDYLRTELERNNWSARNETPLPVVCFDSPDFENDSSFVPAMVQRLVDSGEAWVSVYPVNGRPTIRACITNYNTTEEHIDKLIARLNSLRLSYT